MFACYIKILYQAQYIQTYYSFFLFIICMKEQFQKPRGGGVGYTLNWIKPQVYITDHSKAVLQIWFFVFAYFGVNFCTVFTFYVSSVYLVKFR